MIQIQTIKNRGLAVLLLLFFSGIPIAYAQNQNDVSEYLVKRFRNYCERMPREESFVSTDREEYIAGEELWFNVWLIDRQSSHPSPYSKIVCFELLNPENKPIAQKRIWINNGSGPGCIKLPDSLSTGAYTIRAYTNWMKNFLPSNCFSKKIDIYNAYQAVPFKYKMSEHELLPQLFPDTGRQETYPIQNIKVDNSKQDTLTINVTPDTKYYSDKNNFVIIFIQTRGNINYVAPCQTIGGMSNIAVPKSVLSPGINQITLFDFSGRPIGEKYIFTPEKEQQLLSFHASTGTGTRSKITLELSIDSLIAPDWKSTNFSVSVAPAQNKNRHIGMIEYLIFGSEYGILPETILRGKNLDEIRPELLDSILASLKSEWIDWASILSDTVQELKFGIEDERHYLSGKLSTSNQQAADPGEILLLSNPGKIPTFQYAQINNEAKFHFNIPISDEEQDLIVQTNGVGKDFKISFESSFLGKNMPATIGSDSLVKAVPQHILLMGRNYQVNEIYESTSVGASYFSPSQPAKTLKRFYGKPSTEIRMKDWTKLPTMEEVFFEIVPHVKLKKTGSVYEMVLTDGLGEVLYSSPPTILVDGVFVKDPKIVADLKPNVVERIDVVEEQYMVGDYLFNGIVNVVTQSGDFKGIPAPRNSARLKYRVCDPVPRFESPDYSSEEMRNSRNPDFRNTLFWNPTLQPDKDGMIRLAFWSSDVKSDYEINLQGITSAGKILTIKKYVRVQ